MYGSIAAGLGGAGSGPAFAWALDEAERSGDRLVLLHVCAPGSPLASGRGEPGPAEVEVADIGLARALASARARLGTRRTALQIRVGAAPAALIDASAGVRLLVVGAGEGGRTVRRVLRNAHCPVVVARAAVPSADGVLVGIDGSAAGEMALEFAHAYAGEHHLPLSTVHIPQPGEAAGRHGETGSVADGLISAGQRARLLVLGDKRRGVMGRLRTGDVPLTVALDALCPVVLVPVDQREEAPL
ncbi:universal stress protein [Paractinoplanes hotanensis]|uniref:Universal stress protein n=1 Tax=Paractinoplanes hotanensis TaxID=2906497 RepID=A0ABT0YED9_9ACTN|nr:universal stress protein [Actinoplanes hotanensis]MCM4084404.1 universal stress protein [Actinoplanes hotanensis]